MFADYHVHTSFSDDSECPMETMVQRALELGMDEIAFTEHVDYGVKTDLNCDYEQYFAELSNMREKYGDKLKIRTGIEFGVQRHTVPLFNRDFEMYPFDFVILSNHQVDDKEFWNNRFQPGKTQEQIHSVYYEAIYEVMCKYKNYSVLGHLDMIKRYDPYGSYADEKIMGMVEKILLQAIEDGKGIEVNTSSFKYGIGDLTPSKAILQLYHKLGGRILTIGSDAHDAIRLGDHFDEVLRELKDIGFKEICTFDKMKPVFHKIQEAQGR